MRQVGFHGLAGQLARRILGIGYPRILGQLLPAAPGPGGRPGQRPGVSLVRPGVVLISRLPPLAGRANPIRRI